MGRAESGPMKFGDDWTGVFIRGDNAFGYAMALRSLLRGTTDPISAAQVQGLLSLLAGSDERVTHLSDTQVMRPFDEAIAVPEAR